MESSNGPRPRKAEFAAAIEEGWKKACETYLSESGLKEDSEEWKFIKETKHFSQITDIINETWADYNNPAGCDSSEPAHFVTASSHDVKTIGFKAIVKSRFNKIIGRKESGKIFLQPQSSRSSIQPSYVDERLQLEQKLSGKPSKGQHVIETGLHITDQVEAMNGSQKLKIVVETVLKFSNNLETLVSGLELVSSCQQASLISKWAPYVSLALGCIRYFFKVKSM